jgi:hypothetical protein
MVHYALSTECCHQVLCPALSEHHILTRRCGRTMSTITGGVKLSHSVIVSNDTDNLIIFLYEGTSMPSAGFEPAVLECERLP